MFMAYLFVLSGILGGLLVTYIYDEEMPLLERLCAGTCIGIVAGGLFAFFLASIFGLTWTVILISNIFLLLTSLLLCNELRREQIIYDIQVTLQSLRTTIFQPTKERVLPVLFFIIMALVMWNIFDRAMFERDGGIYTGVDHNLGDLPLHISIINRFVYGQNFPPEHPEYAGARLTYPFLSDFVTAILVQAGMGVGNALFLQNILFALSLIGLLYWWALKLTQDRIAALITPILILFSGGLGWLLIFQKGTTAFETGIFGFLMQLPRYYTMGDGYRWGNILTTILVTQRSILLGLPLFLIIWGLWWKVINQPTTEIDLLDSDQKRRISTAQIKEDSKPVPRIVTSTQAIAIRHMIAAGIIAGMMPLTHAHSFALLMAMGGCLALIFRRWREWTIFFSVALLISVPQLLWITNNSNMSASSFIGWHFGWDRGETDPFWFWLKNTGLFIPLLLFAIVRLWNESLITNRLILFLSPFMLCFIVPNLVRLAPWVWDNIKILIYWYIASAPLVALLLARLWKSNKQYQTLAIALLILATLAGGLDVLRVVTKGTEQEIFNRKGAEFAELVKAKTASRSLILHGPTYNHPIYLTGRRSLMGYDGHLWSHGMDYHARAADVKSIYTGSAEADLLLKRYGVEYVVVGPIEKAMMPVNEEFFNRYQKIGEAGEYRLYKITNS
jgi:hypothetical protein